jgi:triacylglycerol esterase/lipase EstA (alpha/beta hydrolase family)
MSAHPPVLLVHGIWDRSTKLERLRDVLARSGLGMVRAIDLEPNDGRAPIRALAEQVHAAAEALRTETGSAQLDLVGFSMGALVSRTYLQFLGGKRVVRRFVSISGPHAGTWSAYALPFDGTRDMRPRSALLTALAADPDPWGDCEVHVLYTPFDLMIVPARSSELAGARTTTRVPLPLHRLMILHPRATGRVAALLADGT